MPCTLSGTLSSSVHVRLTAHQEHRGCSATTSHNHQLHCPHSTELAQIAPAVVMRLRRFEQVFNPPLPPKVKTKTTLPQSCSKSYRRSYCRFGQRVSLPCKVAVRVTAGLTTVSVNKIFNG